MAYTTFTDPDDLPNGTMHFYHSLIYIRQQGFVDLSMIRHAYTIPRNTPVSIYLWIHRMVQHASTIRKTTPVSRDLWIHRMVPSASTVRKTKDNEPSIIYTLALTITDTLG